MKAELSVSAIPLECAPDQCYINGIVGFNAGLAAMSTSSQMATSA